MIVVTGANGNIGRQVVERLAQIVPASKLGVSVRKPDEAADFLLLGIRVCEGDFTDPDGLAAAFDGAEQVLIVSVNKFGDEAVEQHRNAIQAAKAAGAKRILYTSHQGAGPTSAFAACRENHARTEALLQSSGVPFVSLRNRFYAESALLGRSQEAQRNPLAPGWKSYLDRAGGPCGSSGRGTDATRCVRRLLPFAGQHGDD